jgi:heat shock protein HtpX
MREKLLLVLSLASVALVFAVLTSALAPGLLPAYLAPAGAWWVLDLFGYMLAMAVLVSAPLFLGRYLAPTPTGLGVLKSSMVATMAGVVGGLGLVVLGLSELLGWEATSQLLALAVVFALVPSLFSWLFSPILINLIYGCNPDPAIQEIVNRVAARAGMKPPKAVVATGMREPNAFAYSSPLFGSYVAVTDGMLSLARGPELEAVIGHELGHHKHRDNTVMLIFGLIPSVIYFLGRFLMYSGIYSSSYRYDGDRERKGGSGLLLLLAGVALIIVSVIIQLAVLALSRLREHYADAHGAKVTSPDAMISALASLDSFYNRHEVARTKVDESKLKMLFIYAFAEPFISLEELLATHPPIQRRIAFLRSLKQGQIEA